MDSLGWRDNHEVMTDALSERASPESSGDNDESAAADTRTVSVGDGRTFSYAEYGVPDGRPVVFLHGTPGSRVLGRLLHRSATGNGVRLLAPDRPGYGRSSPHSVGSPSDPELTDIAGPESVAAMLEDAEVDSSVPVVGFSGGGAVALALAGVRPELVAEVDVISGATPPSLSRETPLTQALLRRLAGATPRLLSGLFRGQAWLAERSSPSVVVSQYATEEGQAKLSDDAAELVREDFVTAFERHRTGAVTELDRLGREWDFSLASVECPVRLWHGERDQNVPVADAQRVADRLPDADLTVFEDADHLTALVRGRSRILGRHSTDEW